MRVIRPLSSEVERVCSRLRQADRVLVALDYDGTLAPIAGTPEGARLPPQTAAVLNDLAAADRFTVAVVSGRSLADLKGRLGLDVIYVGNHGLEIEGPGMSFVHPQAEALRGAIDQACWELEAAFESVPAITVERKDLSATVHYRQAPTDLAQWIEATVNRVIRPYLSTIFVGPALKAWEIRPRLQWNKGSAVRYLLGKLDAVSSALVCAGDDTTDEDMFSLRPWAISIKVGTPRNTRARYFVPGVPELLDFLRVLEREGTRAPERLQNTAVLSGLQLLG